LPDVKASALIARAPSLAVPSVCASMPDTSWWPNPCWMLPRKGIVPLLPLIPVAAA
jgi:hypothetical protein